MRTRILWTIFVILLVAAGIYQGNKWYTAYDNNKIKVKAGDCLARDPSPAGVDFFIYVHKVNVPKKWIFFYYINPKQGSFVAAAPTKVFNKRMKKHKTKFIDCKTLKVLREF